MWVYAQILVVVGLVIEFGTVAFTVKKVFWDIHKRLKLTLGKATSKYEMSKEINEHELRDGTIIIVLLSIGMVFQGFAVFV